MRAGAPAPQPITVLGIAFSIKMNELVAFTHLLLDLTYVHPSDDIILNVSTSLQMDVSDRHRGEEEEDRNKPTYCVTDVPPWYLCMFLAVQVGLNVP